MASIIVLMLASFGVAAPAASIPVEQLRDDGTIVAFNETSSAVYFGRRYDMPNRSDQFVIVWAEWRKPTSTDWWGAYSYWGIGHYRWDQGVLVSHGLGGWVGTPTDGFAGFDAFSQGCRDIAASPGWPALDPDEWSPYALFAHDANVTGGHPAPQPLGVDPLGGPCRTCPCP